ncbi:MAG: hydantoinase/oxoprolinase family protein [Pseudomonadota bacterium]
MTRYRVSADIGGTFTDIVIEPSDGPVFVGKTATTPADPAGGVINGIGELIDDRSQIEFFVHGTTVGLNAFLERKGERVLLITTKGHGDAYTIARGNRHTLYELRYRKPDKLVPRSDVHEVSGRRSWDGTELEPMDPADFDPIIAKVKAEGINAVAVCLLHAYAYPEHEVQARKILNAALPELSVSLSHEIAREWREYERASSVVMNAYVAPVVERYLKSLQSTLKDQQMDATVHIMQSNGGITTADRARELPVYTLLSGPVGGTIAGTALAASGERKNLLCVDMGGTSFDLSLVVGGEANTTLETELEGLPLLMSIVDIQTIGTGGGSIAWLDGGAMRVGPHSAGSQPGPACYGRGGTEPTVTDANLYLGRLGNSSLLGGDMNLDEAAASSAIARKAEEAGLDAVRFAEGILAISNAAMADAMRTITVSEGLDPREFALVAFGGAGPMAAAFLAEELDIAEVVVPRFPGTFSAWGMLQTDLRQDLSVSFFKALADTQLSELNTHFESLEQDGRAQVARQGIGDGAISALRTADMRYIGQEYSINVPVLSGQGLTALVEAFHDTHERRHGHANRNAPVEFVNLRLAAFGAVQRYDHASTFAAPGTDPQIGERTVTFAGQAQPAAVLFRDRMPLEFTAAGPVIVEEKSATTVVPPGWTLSQDNLGSLILKRGA